MRAERLQELEEMGTNRAARAVPWPEVVRRRPRWKVNPEGRPLAQNVRVKFRPGTSLGPFSSSKPLAVAPPGCGGHFLCISGTEPFVPHSV
jgi:hypothetical protein